jgi:hypothetical protein
MSAVGHSRTGEQSLLQELIYLNIIAPGMDQHSAMSKQPKMAERLLAHARMCREVADECGNKELAADFNKLALECIQAAAACKEQPSLRNDARLVLL